MCLILGNTSFRKQCPFYKTNKYEDSKDNETNTDNGTESITPDYSISNLQNYPRRQNKNYKKANKLLTLLHKDKSVYNICVSYETI